MRPRAIALSANARQLDPSRLPPGRSAYLLSIVTGADGVGHQGHEGRGGNDENHRMDMFTLGGEKIFVVDKDDLVFDADGHQLVHGNDGNWTSFQCAWSPALEAAARTGDLTKVHGLLVPESYGREMPACSTHGVAVAEARVAKLEQMLAPVAQVRAQSPQFIRELALGNEDIKEVSPDLADVLAKNMSWYVEWPHVHGKIVSVYATLPGFTTRHALEDTWAAMNGN